MKKQILIGIIIIIVVIILVGGYFGYQQLNKQSKPVACTTEAKICPDGSYVGRTGPNCDFAPCPDWKNYTNNEFGFNMTFPDSWKGYTVVEQSWVGHVINNYQQTYSGPMIVFKNPQTTSTQPWQDIPIMVFTPEVWNMVSGNNPTVSVSAAPIGPAKVGENAKYVFATPPRWYGFTDAIGFQEAVDIVKTFKAY